jgi:hypothetical protein
VSRVFFLEERLDLHGPSCHKVGRKTMKPFFLAGALALFPLVSQGQNYSIDWYSIDGGGGTSTGGVYTLSGTIGQPDAGRLTGASYALEGGFWGFVGALQTAGSPLLSVERMGTSVRVFWPASATGFVLEQATSLSGPAVSWQNVLTAYQTNAIQISITVSGPVGMKVYRLRKP